MAKVVYILGESHCGSTILSFLLNCHPDIVSVGEASPGMKNRKKRHLRLCSCGKPIMECDFWQKVFQEMSGKGIVFTPLKWRATYDYSNPVMRKIFNRNHSNQIINDLRKMVIALAPFYNFRIRKRNRVNLEFINTILELTNSKFFVDASKNSHRLEYLMKIPELDIRVIWLIRDVRAFANSFKRKNKPVVESAERWRKAQIAKEGLFEKIAEDRKMLIRYEDLCRAPQENMNSIFRFVGAPPANVADNFRNAPHHILGNRMRLNNNSKIVFDEKWKVNLTKSEQNDALEIAGDVAASFDYH